MYGILLLGVVCVLMFVSGQQNEQQNDGNDYHFNPIFNLNQYGTGNTDCSQKPPSNSLSQDMPRDCTDVRNQGHTRSGQYVISPQDDDPPFRVYCDMTTDGEGWTVFQRREDGSVDFYLDWADYERGFGNTNSEHWLGNKKIHRISAQGHYQLRVNMTDFEGNSVYADYDNFRLGDAGTKYKLIIGTYSGDAGDSLTSHANQSFTTKDMDNDIHDSTNCAEDYKGAWWYTACHSSNLNGLYLGGSHDSYANGVNWVPWKGHRYSLKHVEMKIKISS